MTYKDFSRTGFFVFDQPGFWFNRGEIGGSACVGSGTAKVVAGLVEAEALKAGAIHPCGRNVWQVLMPACLPRPLRGLPVAA